MTLATWVTTQPSWRATPASDYCRICKWSSRAGRPWGPIHSQEPRPLARAARSLTAGSALVLGARRADDVRPALGPPVRCAAQAQGRAVAQPCAPGGALVRHVRNQARCAAWELGRVSAVRQSGL
jgi:hypothetical protein